MATEFKITDIPTTATAPAADDYVELGGSTNGSRKALAHSGLVQSYFGSKSVKTFGAVGDGATDDTSAIQATIDSFSASGAVYFPAGTYLISNTLTQNYPVRFFGDGDAPVDFSAAQSTIKKSASLNGPALLISERGSVVEGLAFNGVAGNGGDGIVVWSNDVTLRSVGVFNMGQDGIRIGKDTGVLPSINANTWRLLNVRCAYNVRHGVYVNDKLIAAPDANAGIAVAISCNLNGGDGIKQANALANTYSGVLCEGNTGWGINFAPTAADSIGSAVVGGDSEGNTAGKISLSANCQNYLVALGNNTIGDPVVDGGPNNQVLPSGATSNECLQRYTYAVVFAGARRYHAWAADANDRLRVGWSNAALEAGLVAAQILADSTDLNFVTRDISSGAFQFYAGDTNVLALTMDKNSVRPALPLAAADGLVATPSITFAGDLNTGFFRPAGDAIEVTCGGTRAAYITAAEFVVNAILRPTNAVGATIRAGSGSPEGAVSATPGSIFMRSDGGAGTSVYQKVSGSGNTLWTAIA